MGEVTGVILAGGRGQRMGGLDKGLQPFLGQRLIDHAVDRLKPQVDHLVIVANRHMDIYGELGCPVVNDASVGPAGRLGEPQAAPDAPLRFEGPMAGLLAGLKASKTPWLATVPCDSPFFPLNLVERLLSVATRVLKADSQGAEGGLQHTLGVFNSSTLQLSRGILNTLAATQAASQGAEDSSGELKS